MKNNINFKNLIILVISGIIIISSLFFILKFILLNSKDTHIISNIETNVTINKPSETDNFVNEQQKISNDINDNNDKTIKISFTGAINYDLEIQSSSQTIEGTYNTDSIFKYIGEIIKDRYCVSLTDNSFISNNILSDINAPTELLNTLSKIGVKLLGFGGKNILNNGILGLNSNISESKKYNINTYGINIENPDTPFYIQDFNGFKIAFILFNQSISRAAKYAIDEDNIDNYVNTFSHEKAVQCIETAKSFGADMIIANVIWNNYSDIRINEVQKNTAHFLASAGADIILGSLSNSPQECEIITSFDSNGKKKNVPIIYSLGSLLSSDRDRTPRYSSIILNLDINYDKNKAIKSMVLDYTPIYNWKKYNDKGYEYILLNTFNKEEINLNDIQKGIIDKVEIYIKELYSNLKTTVFN